MTSRAYVGFVVSLQLRTLGLRNLTPAKIARVAVAGQWAFCEGLSLWVFGLV